VISKLRQRLRGGDLAIPPGVVEQETEGVVKEQPGYHPQQRVAEYFLAIHPAAALGGLDPPELTVLSALGCQTVLADRH